MIRRIHPARSIKKAEPEDSACKAAALQEAAALFPFENGQNACHHKYNHGTGKSKHIGPDMRFLRCSRSLCLHGIRYGNSHFIVSRVYRYRLLYIQWCSRNVRYDAVRIRGDICQRLPARIFHSRFALHQRIFQIHRILYGLLQLSGTGFETGPGWFCAGMIFFI